MGWSAHGVTGSAMKCDDRFCFAPSFRLSLTCIVLQTVAGAVLMDGQPAHVSRRIPALYSTDDF